MVTGLCSAFWISASQITEESTDTTMSSAAR